MEITYEEMNDFESSVAINLIAELLVKNGYLTKAKEILNKKGESHAKLQEAFLREEHSS